MDWDALFSALAEVEFEGILTSCVFAWEEKAIESSQQMLEAICLPAEISTRIGAVLEGAALQERLDRLSSKR